MKIALKKPLVFIDLETTGISVTNDRICEISLLKVSPDGNEEIKTFRVNPGIPIPKEVTAIHGISNEDVKDKPTFKEIARQIEKFIEDCDLAGYNSHAFDFPLLVEEFMRADIDFDKGKRKLIDVQVIFHKMEPRTLGAAFQFYCNKNLEKAHSAEADTIATYEVFKSQLERYDTILSNIDKITTFSTYQQNVDFAGRIVYNENGVEVFNFGKFKGQLVEDVLKKEPGFYNWLMNNDFPLYTKRVLTRIRLRGLANKIS